jgi:hypothetical protein
MWQIRRIHLDAIGTPAGRFADVTIDLADGRGRPMDSILWLRNGGGKSTIMALLGALLRPGRTDFLSAAEHRNDVGRHLEDYVLGNDTAHVVVEWADGARRLVTGAVYEWTERTAPADANAAWERLTQRWYAFAPDGNEAEMSRLPFRLAGHPTELEAFCSAVRALPASTEAVVARTHIDWERTLTARGIDPDLWRTILAMNESEGGIEHQFLFSDADDFVAYLLRLIVDPSIPAGVAKILGQVVTELADRPAVEADLAFCVAAVERLTTLDGAWRSAVDAAELVRIATADARVLRGSLLAAADVAEADAAEAAAAVGTAQGDAAAARSASDVARDTGNEYARLAALMREEAADARITDLTERMTAAEGERDAWAATPRLADLADARERLATLTVALAAAEEDAAPLAARRAETAGALTAALVVVIAEATAEAGIAEAAAAAETAAATDARAAHAAAVTEAAQAEAALAAARRAIARHEADIAAARRDGVLLGGEEPAEAATRLRASEERDDADEDAIATAEAADRLAVARDRVTRDRAVEERERATGEAATARRLHNDLARRRDEIAADARMAFHLPAEGADIVAAGSLVTDSIGAAIRRADADLTDLALDGADDVRALAAIAETDLLPPAPDLARALAALATAGISAVGGWTYLAEIVSPDRRLATFLAAPDLAGGVLVQNPADLPRARETLDAADLRVTTVLALGTTADLEVASGQAGRFVVEPNAALYDAGRADEERVRREAAMAARTTRAAAIADARDADRGLAERLRALLAEMPAERLPALVRSAEAADAVAASAVAAIAEIDGRAKAAAARTTEREERLTTLRARRRQTVGQRSVADQLAAAADALGPDREVAASAPGRIETAMAAAAVADEAERGAAARAATAALRGQALRGDIDRLAERAANVGAAPDPDALPEGWSLDALDAAWREATDAWRSATVGSAVAAEHGEAERAARRIAEELATIAAPVRERAEALLHQSDGATAAGRARATAAAEALLGALAVDLGEARTDKRNAHADLVRLEADRDRQRHRVVERPATVEEALAAERTCRVEQDLHAKARAEADERARREEGRAKDATVRASALVDQANTIEASDDDGPRDVIEPFEGSVDEARVKAREVSRSLGSMRDEEAAARRALAAVGAEIVSWAGSDTWAAVTLEVRSRFRVPDVADELGPDAARFRDDVIELRRVELIEHLRSLDVHRDNVVNHTVGMVRGALRSLARFSALSKLPEDLGAWSAHRFIEVGPKAPADERDDAVMRDRVGRAVDAVIAAGTASISGSDLLWRAMREVVGPAGFRARVLKPSPTFSTERIGVDRMRKWSGGEKVTMALLLFVTVARLRAANRGRDMAGAGALVLDNPLGKANYVLFLELQRRVAAAAGVQLVFLTGVADMKAVGLFPNVVRMRNAPDSVRRRGYVQVTDRDLRTDDEIATVTATRVYRTDDQTSLSLA